MSNTQMQKAFLAANGEKPRKQPKPKPPRQRRSPIKAVSDAQAVRNAFLDGLKTQRIDSLLLIVGFAQCENCETSFDNMRAAKNGLDLHHLDKRSRGARYKPGVMGIDAPRNLILCCRSCHRALEASEPEWSGAPSESPSPR